MQNYIRTCLSLDKETRNKAINLKKTLQTSMSGAIKEAINFLTNHIEIWKEEEQIKIEKFFDWRK